MPGSVSGGPIEKSCIPEIDSTLATMTMAALVSAMFETLLVIDAEGSSGALLDVFVTRRLSLCR